MPRWPERRRRPAPASPVEWAGWREARLRQEYPSCPDLARLAESLGCTRKALVERARKLGVRRRKGAAASGRCPECGRAILAASARCGVCRDEANHPPAASGLPEPTDHPPGSAGKVAELERRCRAGLALWHPQDAQEWDGGCAEPAKARPDLPRKEQPTKRQRREMG